MVIFVDRVNLYFVLIILIVKVDRIKFNRRMINGFMFFELLSNKILKIMK